MSPTQRRLWSAAATAFAASKALLLLESALMLGWFVTWFVMRVDFALA